MKNIKLKLKAFAINCEDAKNFIDVEIFFDNYFFGYHHEPKELTLEDLKEIDKINSDFLNIGDLLEEVRWYQENSPETDIIEYEQKSDIADIIYNFMIIK